MKPKLIFGIAVILLAVGCSKSVDPSAGMAEVKAPPPPTKGADQVNPMMNSGLSDIDKKLDANQYEAAVGSLVSLKDMRMTPKDDEAFQRRLTSTLQVLSERAAAGDERAREAQRMLGHMITGR